VRKNVVKSFKMLENADLSAPLTSIVVNVINMDKASIHVAWVDLVGTSTMTVQVRNGEDDSWYDLDMSSVITLSGSGGNHQLLFTELPFTDIRLQTTAATSGTVNCSISMKQVGG
jgi:hypothetical protein